MNIKILVIMALFVFHSVNADPGQRPPNTQLKQLTIGVLAYRGKANAIKRWQKTIDYLDRKLPDYKLSLRAFTLGELEQHVKNKNVDFIVTNTGQYVTLEYRYGISRIATLVNKRLNKTTTRFGAVIFVRADNKEIQTIQDLKGKSFMGVHENGFGGFQMAWRELKKNGIDPYSDFSELRFSGYPQTDVLRAVLQGEVDAGTFRSDSLEQLASSGKLRLNQIRIINEKFTRGFPYIHSTQVYPEWPFAKLKHTPYKLSKKIAMLLLTIEENSDAAIDSISAGWTVPLDYQPVHELMRELSVGPYKDLNKVTVARLMAQYGHWLAIGIVVLLVITFLLFRVHRLNVSLRKSNNILQKEVQHRIELADAMEYQAMHDALTGILNRHAFSKLLKTELNRARRYSGQFAVILIDIDDFKEVNDTYGHQVGDIYLIQFAQRIKNVLRTSDAMARIGGDEFAIISIDIKTPSDVAVLSRRINIENQRPYRVDNLDLNTSVSIGAAIYGMHGDTDQQLLHHADVQMYEHKKSHKTTRRIKKHGSL
jgi:diguanylate cyclase (GGDEF)-like protein